MDESGFTSEFSICLTLSPETTSAVNAVRESMAASPYRDDTPHITLLRTIKCPRQMSDADLLQDIERILELSKNLPFTARVKKLANVFSPLFRTSSLINLTASSEMKSYRKHVLKTLKANNYSVGIVEHIAYLPHISVRLGVPYTAKTKQMTERSFPNGTELNFENWIILRDIKRDGKYLVKEISIAN
jgi:hypothetical protein